MKTEFQEKSSRRKSIFQFIVAGAVLISLATTLTASISIGNSGRVQFSQEVYTIRGCDDFIRLNLTTTSYSQSEGAVLYQGSYVPAVSGIQIDGFDSQQCKNKNFSITIFETHATTPASLFQNGTSPDSTAHKVWFSVDNAGTVNLLNSDGVNVSSGDSYQSINYSQGQYRVVFTTPKLAMPAVGVITVESASNN